MIDVMAAALAAVEDNLEELRGPQGPEGKAGDLGPQGFPGRPGVNGTDGKAGLDGQNGANGAPGAPGADGQDGDGISWRGPWKAGSYDAQDAVEFEGSSYIARTRTRAKPPGGGWDLMAQKGQDGKTILRPSLSSGGPGGGSGGSGLPAGGAQGQVLVKQSGTDGDAIWVTEGIAEVLTAGDIIDATTFVIFSTADPGGNTGAQLYMFPANADDAGRFAVQGGDSVGGNLGASINADGGSDDSQAGGSIQLEAGDGGPAQPGGSVQFTGGPGDAAAGGSGASFVVQGGGPGPTDHGRINLTTDNSTGTVGQVLTAQGDDTAIWADPTGGGSLTQTHISVTPTCSTSPAYSAGDAVGGLLTFSGAAASGSSGTISVATVMSKTQALLPALELVLFNQTFTASTDNAVFAPSDGDMANCLGSIPITNWSDFSVNSIATRFGLGMGYLLTGTDLFGQLVTRTAFTLAGTTDLVVSVTVAKD